MTSLGRFRIIIRLRIDNPAFPQYVIYRGARLVGCQFSVPTLSDCEWLERQELNRIIYAQESAKLLEHSIKRKGGRPISAFRLALLEET